MRLAIVGASGFVGCRLLETLTEEYCCQALSRRRPDVRSKYDWSSCDLHNLKDLESSMQGCDIAIYLVHSMLASASLNQGHFADFDISLADNFGRAAKSCGVKKVIYLSGLMPEGKTSIHLESRQEVERLLRWYYPNATILRAGIICGAKGSSFRMMYRLSKKLPVMLCPSWTSTLGQAVYVDDVVKSIKYCLENQSSDGMTYDIGSEPPLSYEQMMKIIGKKLGREPHIFHVDTVSPLLSSYWLTLVSGAPLELTRPLVGSLKEPMLVRSEHRIPLEKGSFVSFEKGVDAILSDTELAAFNPPHAYKSWFHKQSSRQVRSIQRLVVPKGWTAENLAREYMNWLPQFLKSFISVECTDGIVAFKLCRTSLQLLTLQYSPKRSDQNRQLFYIVGGVLATAGNKKARLEFRKLPHEPSALAAIHDFKPALPWIVYRFSQAMIHDYVMGRFSAHLLAIEGHSTLEIANF